MIYLCNQERFDFSLKDIIRDTHSARGTYNVILDWYFPIISTLVVLFERGVSPRDLSGDGQHSILCARMLQYFEQDLDSSDKQAYLFNGAVLEFLCLLQAGVDPYEPFELGIGSYWTPSEFASLDPHFTTVACTFALVVYESQRDGDGNDGGRPDAEVEDDNNSSVAFNHEVTIASDDEPNSDELESEVESETSSDSDLDSFSVGETDAKRTVPGAWVDDEKRLPIRRKFKSKIEDFNGLYNGIQWHKWLCEQTGHDGK